MPSFKNRNLVLEGHALVVFRDDLRLSVASLCFFNFRLWLLEEGDLSRAITAL